MHLCLWGGVRLPGQVAKGQTVVLGNCFYLLLATWLLSVMLALQLKLVSGRYPNFLCLSPPLPPPPPGLLSVLHTPLPSGCDSHFILAHPAVPYPPPRHCRSPAIFSGYSRSQGHHVVDRGDSKVKPHDLPSPGHAGPAGIDTRQPAMWPLLRVSDGESGRRTLFCHGVSPAHLVRSQDTQ